MIYFDEEKHRYIDENGKEYKGVTEAIGKLLGKSFPDIEKVKVHTSFGSQVHKEVENHIMKGAKCTIDASKKAVELIKQIKIMHQSGRADTDYA